MLQRDFLKAHRNSTGSNHSSPTVRPLKKSSRQSSALPLSPVNINAYLNGNPGTSPRSSSLGMAPRSPGLPPVVGGGEAVHVAVRCRPPLPSETSSDVIVSMDAARREIYVDGEAQPWRVDAPLWSGGGPTRDGAATVTQAALYERIGRPLLLHALEGYNSTMMAYGQTGSGKTYTMMGSSKDDEEAGLIPRFCHDLFEELRRRSFTTPAGESISWEVSVRYVEVYCEKVTDLLNGNAAVGLREEVTPQSATFALLGARRIKAESSADLLQALQTGNKCRRTAATKANDRSSRSHAIFIMELTELLSFTEPDGTVVSAPSKAFAIRLVDLAGSERVSETGVQGIQLKEARDINLSLFTLGLVIECLTDSRRSMKPPYRDSVLTKILRDAFGGNSKTTMVCTISPNEVHRQQTLQTLSYAAKARSVVNKPRVEEDPGAAELRRANEEMLTLRRELSEAKRTGQEHAQLEAQLREAQQKMQRDQQEMKKRRELMEKREQELAKRLQEVEVKKESFESQMAALEGEVELARKQQKLREAELRRAHQLADEEAQKRLRELEVQRDASEKALHAKEEELLSQQHAVEQRLAELETSSRARVDQLVHRQKDLEEELRQKEELANSREVDLRRKTQLAEQQARLLSQRSRSMEQEWEAKVKALEVQAQRREEEITVRAREAKARLRAQEEAAKRTEEEMRQQRFEAEKQARTLQAEMEAKQVELDRHIIELQRQAREREDELNARLQKAEFDLHQRERESAQHQREMESIKQAAARECASSRDRALNLVAQNDIVMESLGKKEEMLKKREEELAARFAEVMEMRQQWEQKFAKKEADLQTAQEESASILRGRALYLQQKESDLRRLEDELDAKERALDMQTQRKHLEFLALKNDFEAQMQREKQANARAKEELQFQRERIDAEGRIHEEKLQRWEDDLLKRRNEHVELMKARETNLRQRESAAAAAEDRATAKALQTDQLAKRLDLERKELFDHSTIEAEGNLRDYNSLLLNLRQQQRELEQLRRTAGSEASTPDNNSKNNSVSAEESAKMRAAQKALFRREIFSFFAFESMYRGNIVVQEEMNFRNLVKEKQLDFRDIFRCKEIANQCDQLNAVRSEAEHATAEQARAQGRARDWQEQLHDLKEQLRATEQELAEVRVQLTLATSVARDAEDSLQRQSREISFTRDQQDEYELELREKLTTTRAQLEVEIKKSNRYGRLLYEMINDQEERERSLLEYQRSRELMWVKGLDLAERKSVVKLQTIEKWQALYQERSGIVLDGGDGAAAAAAVDAQARDLHGAAQTQEELQRQAQSLAADQQALQHRIVSFESECRRKQDQLRQQEEKVKLYLLELEAMDRERMAKYEAQEKKFVDMAVAMHEREGISASQLQGVCRSLFLDAAAQDNEARAIRQELEQDGRLRLAAIEHEQELCRRALGGDREALEELRRCQEAALHAESARLEARLQSAQDREQQRRERVLLGEAQIREYLLFLEQEDIRRGALTSKGEAYLKEAEARLQTSKQKERRLRDLARRLQLEALELEEQSRLMESDLQQREHDLQTLRERKAEVEQRRAETTSRVEDTERTLLDLETDLRTILNKNKDTKRAIRARDAELKRQKVYYKDLSAMLAERERMLREEHAHRMDGKHSANWLARDLLDRNTLLESAVKKLRQRWRTLLVEDRIECEVCAWANMRQAKFCRCCGHDLLAEQTNASL